MMAVLELLPVVIKLIVYLLERTKKQPNDERRKFLADFDAAIEKARKGDPRELSQWLGRHL